MPTLPDINTNLAAHLACWNALDNGASDLAPADLLEYPGVETWEEYANGLDGTLDRHPALRWRAKTDGWLVVWFDESYGTVSPEDFIVGFDAQNNPDLTKTVLSEELNALRQHAAESDAMTFTHADVVHYNYRYPDMSHWRLMHASADQNYGGSVDGGYAYNPGTDGPYHYIIDAFGSYGGYVNVDGQTIVSSDSNSTPTNRARLAEQGVLDTPDYYYETTSWVPLAGDASHTTLVVE